jgi:hypothetical protein
MIHTPSRPARTPPGGPARKPSETAEAPPGGPGGASRALRVYRYWPVFDAVSIARPVASFLPVTRVRM